MSENKLPKDSGSTQEFQTGAHRDNPSGKGRCDLLPLDTLCALTSDNFFGLLHQFITEQNDEYAEKAIHLVINRLGEKYTPKPLGENNEPIDAEREPNQLVYATLLDASLLYEAGAMKYGSNNWKKGMPVKRYVDSAIRHYIKAMAGWVDEPHFRACIWNLTNAIWTSKNKPEMWNEPVAPYDIVDDETKDNKEEIKMTENGMTFNDALRMLLTACTENPDTDQNPQSRPQGWDEAIALIGSALVNKEPEPEPEEVIDTFTGEYTFLANGYPAPVRYDGMTFNNVVSAFQAAKTLDKDEREQFVWADPRTAVRLGHNITLRPDWEDIKVSVMTALVTCKFCCNDVLTDKLLATGDKKIIAGKGAHTDSFWGVDKNGEGENMLGQILMTVRSTLARKRDTRSFSDAIRLYWVVGDNDEEEPSLFWLTQEDVDWHEDHNFTVTPFLNL